MNNRVTVDRYNLLSAKKTNGLIQQGNNVGWALNVTTKRVTSILLARKEVSFTSKVKVTLFKDNNKSVTITHNSRAAGHCISTLDKVRTGMMILCRSEK